MPIGKPGLAVIDPAVPGVELVERQAMVISGDVVYVPATSWDAASGTARTLGYSQVLYTTRDGLFRADLRGGRDHASVLLSGIPGACRVQALDENVIASSRDGTQAWMKIYTKDSFGSCGGIPQFIRVHADTSVETVSLPARDVSHVVLEDATGLFDGMLLADDQGIGPQKVYVADRDLSAWHALDAQPGAQRVIFAADPAHPRSGWLALADGLHAVSWGDGGFVVGPIVDAAIRSVSALAADNDGLWIGSSTELLRLDRAGVVHSIGSLEPTLGSVGSFHSITALATHAMFETRTDRDAKVRFGVASASGVFLPDVPAPGYEDLYPVAEAGDLSLLAMRVLGPSGEPLDVTYGRVDAAGVFTTGPNRGIVVRAATRRPGQAAEATAFWQCAAGVPSPKLDECGPGVITEVALSGSDSMAIGTLVAAGAQAPTVQLDQWRPGDRPLLQGLVATQVVCASQSSCTVYGAVPGQSGSLKKLLDVTQ